ncbi:unnamed protein product, partial [Allacma fusca]
MADVRQLLDIYSKSDGRVRCMMVEAGVPPEDVLERINSWYDVVPEGNWATFLIGNHDQKRAPTRWTE